MMINCYEFISFLRSLITSNKKEDKLRKDFQILQQIHAFFIINTFVSNARLKLVKNPAKAKQHPEAEL